eukprot:CAMPEP_0171457906 /NCGR_PEP_ID=MMETSP0945-20130129/3792_1 /TAXON_ID=109269 /ORGANISM="Vaucheria litorea, Strain CCMP2940" /LENGTH=329 /DNA_ID=CAMNT_0011983597 /DNA_START=115 /DNA_END=1104 /DNA_ORIENTATION=+
MVSGILVRESFHSVHTSLVRTSLSSTSTGKKFVFNDGSEKVHEKKDSKIKAEIDPTNLETSENMQSKIHSRRSLFDSADTLQNDDEITFQTVNKEVKSGTPDKTRFSVFDSDYGKENMPSNAEDIIKGLKTKEENLETSFAAIHSRRAMFDSELSMQINCEKELKDFEKKAKTDTPDVTRLSVFDSDYGKEIMPENAHQKVEGLSGKIKRTGKVSAVHSRRAMYDSALSMQTACDKDYTKVSEKVVKTGTPDITRLSVFDSDYGKETMPENAESFVKGLKGVRNTAKKVSQVHNTEHAFFDSDYGKETMPENSDETLKDFKEKSKRIKK